MSEEANQSNERLLQMALQLKHVQHDPSSLTSPFQCNLCKVSFSGNPPLLQHLHSAKHKKKVTQHSAVAAVLSPTSPESLSEDDHFVTPSGSQESLVDQDLPHISDVKEALEKGHIVEDRGSTTSPYHCKLCFIPLSGLEPLQQHMESAKHLKKAASRSIYKESSSSEDGSFEISTIEMATPEHLSAQPVEGYIVKDPGSTTSPFQCKACNIVLSGLEPLEQHVKSAKHIKKTMDSSVEKNCSFEISKIEMTSPELHPAQPVDSNSRLVQDALNKGHIVKDPGSTTSPFQCKACNIVLSGLEPLEQHVKSAKHIKKTMESSSETFDMSGIKTALIDTVINEEVSPIINKAIEDGHVSKDESSPSGAYKCNICQVPLTGVKPVEQHLQGTNHLVKARQNDNIQNLSENLPTLNKTLDTTSTPELPIWAEYKVLPSENPEQPNENTYKNLSTPQGHVYIFNNTFKNDPKYVRPGAECDSVNLKYVFERMGYKVFIYHNLTREETYNTIKEIQKDKKLEKIDSFIMVILSHGEDSTKFYASDMEMIHIDNIRFSFIDGKCPQLKGKARIFMCNYCRGNIKEKKLQTDAPENYPGKEAPKDMVTIHASIDGFSALRDPLKGTVFAQSLCETLSKHAHNMEFRFLYRVLANVMTEKSGTTPELQEFVFKNFYFNPRYIE